VVRGGGHLVVAPFPVEIREGTARIEAPEGEAYQVVIDGERVVEIEAGQPGVIPLD
jgi:hypothetical protein